MTHPGSSHAAEQPHPARTDVSAPESAALPEAPDLTGDPAVDAVTASLAALDGLPVDQHVAVFESAHDRLREVLDPGGAGVAHTTPSASAATTTAPTT